MEVKRRGRGPNLPDEIKESIALMRHNDPKKWTAEELQKFWSEHLQDPDFVKATFNKNKRFRYYKFPKGYPSIRATQGEVGRQNKNIEKSLDAMLKDPGKPWSIMSLSEHPIPPDALPSVLKVWAWVRENTDGLFSIREAQWVARLYTVTEDLRHLAQLSRIFTLGELIYKVIGKSPEDYPNHEIDLYILEEMTGQEITDERKKKIFKLSEEEWRDKKILEEYLKKHGFEFDQQIMDHIYQKYVKPQVPGAKRIILKKEEAQNEGTHNQEG